MSFLQPLWLALAAGVAVPLVLHLLRRRIENRVDFPAVAYLLRAERENVRQLKVRNLLLMMLRVLAVLFLALTAARPVGWMLGAGHVPTAIAMVLDNSASTSVIVNGAPLLNTLKHAATRVVDDASASDQLWLLTADGRVVGGSKSTVKEAIDRAAVFEGRGDLSAVISRGAGLALAAGLPAREVAVVTDGQASAWPSATSIGDVRVVVLAAGGATPANRAVVAAEGRPPRWTPRGTLYARIGGSDTATYRVSLGTRTLTRGVAREGEEVSLRAEPAERGWQRGVVEITPDELRADDVRHFAVWIGGAPAVRAEPGAGVFVQNALSALMQNERISFGDEVEVGPADAITRLPALIHAPGDPVRLGAANRALERLGVPWRFGAVHRDETVVRGAGFDGVATTMRYALVGQAAVQAETLATAAGEPWAAAGERYVILGSALDPSATTFPLRANFLPWIGDVLAQRLAGDATLVLNAAPGARVHLPAGVDAAEGDDGQPVPLRAVDGTRDVLAPARPGVYFLRRGAERVGALAVNAEPEESDLRRLDERTLASRFRARDVVVTTDAGRWQRAAFDVGARRPLQPTFLILALLCLAGELFVVRRDERPPVARAA